MLDALTWQSPAQGPLIGCGIDAERIARFEKPAGESAPWPLVFSEREAAHARTLRRPAEGLCAAFCVKEALFKALEAPFAFPQCEFLFDPGAASGTLVLSPALADSFGVRRNAVTVLRPTAEELLAVVYLFGATSDE